MSFAQRIKLYIFGFLLGLLILAMILKGKKCSGVSEMKLVELLDQRNYYSERLKCQLACTKIPVDSLGKVLLRDFHINYDRSEVHALPAGKYFVEPNKKDTYPFTLVILDVDTVSHIEQLDLTTDCKCDSLSNKIK